MKRSFVSSNDDSTGETSVRLLAEAQLGQATAWQRMVGRYGRRVYRWCRCAGLQPADSSNVTQEVFQAVARALPTFERGDQVGSFRCWIRTITRNKIHDQFRQMVRQCDQARGGTDALLRLENVANDEYSDSSDSGRDNRFENRLALGPADYVRLADIRKGFSTRDWQLFWRLVVDGQNATEVAQEFEMTANAVRLVKMRILRRLREEFNALPSERPRASE
ncbi:MAG: sigma-70 family RNA polymerase sigma factor [Planctomycetota bacterium]|nr:sigma-70 family RNA polymerase sigma factor [Planctomycetota bacterium]MDA1179400.1 sigma-70 family RNA polymerase sigma factor [Planctomycetota bacterium]